MNSGNKFKINSYAVVKKEHSNIFASCYCGFDNGIERIVFILRESKTKDGYVCEDSDGGWHGYIPAKYLKSLTNKQRKGIVSEIMYAREKMEFFERALGQLEGVVSEEVK